MEADYQLHGDRVCCLKCSSCSQDQSRGHRTSACFIARQLNLRIIIRVSAPGQSSQCQCVQSMLWRTSLPFGTGSRFGQTYDRSALFKRAHRKRAARVITAVERAGLFDSLQLRSFVREKHHLLPRLHEMQDKGTMRQNGATVAELPADALPQHVAMILDGNRRWAKQQGMQSCVRGHEAGAQTLKTVAVRCQELGIRALTVFAFSTENWQRSTAEVNGLLHLMESTISSGLDELCDAGVKLTFFGELERLPKSLQTAIIRANERTAHHTGLQFSVAISYGGKQDIIAATKKAADLVASGQITSDQITEELFESLLLTHDCVSGFGPPDLLIRTSGEMRLSNFMLWDLAYSELFFSSKLWPDFGAADLDEAVASFAGRARRYGRDDANAAAASTVTKAAHVQP
eukprot:jgi/Ulvmu1/1111/UM106_0028.1